MVGKARSVDMFDFDPTEGAGAEAEARAVELSGVWESSQVCPYCGASEEEAPGTISYSSYDGEYRDIWQDARCSRCDAMWSESYYLQGATGDGEGGFAVLAGSLLDAAFDVLASGGDGLALRTLGDAVRGIVGVQGATELERRRAELAGPCLCGETVTRECRSACRLTSTPCSECGALIADANPSEFSTDHEVSCSLHPDNTVGAGSGAQAPGCACVGSGGAYILTTWAPVYVTVSEGKVTRVRVDDEGLNVAGLPGVAGIAVPSYVTCGVCDTPVDEATAQAVRYIADVCDDWPGWELGA